MVCISREHALQMRGAVARAVTFGSKGSCCNFGPGHRVLFWSWERHLTLTVPLSTQVYKWVPANLMLGITLRWISILSRESRSTHNRLIPQKSELINGSMGLLSRKQTFFSHNTNVEQSTILCTTCSWPKRPRVKIFCYRSNLLTQT